MTTPLSGTPLNPDEQRFCAMLGITTGIDRDDCNPQLTHLCWPYDLYWGALCGTNNLWASDNTPAEKAVITCGDCLRRLEILQAGDPVLLAAIGALNQSLTRMNDLHAAVADYLYNQDRPLPTDITSEEAREDMNGAMEAVAAHWKQCVDTRGNRPKTTPNGWKLP